MKIIREPFQFQREMEKLRTRGRSIGFVPTMGALHEGHLSLVRKARKENKIVVVSIFVNPLQFGPREDFKRYPRNGVKDQSLLAQEGIDYLFLPDHRLLYPSGYQTYVEVHDLSQGLCGKFRPGHFKGVATVVAKLFNLVRPHRAYFGAKDYQQARIIQQLAIDLNFNVGVKVLPLVRDRDGLALSSRNQYLTPAERQRALAIPEALNWAKGEVERGNRNFASLRGEVDRRLKRGFKRLDYVEWLEPKTLKSVTRLKGKIVLAIAGWVGKTRLIDNVIMTAK